RLVADAVATAVDHRKAAEHATIAQEHKTLSLAHRTKGDIHGSLTIDAAVVLSHPRQGDTRRHIQGEPLAGLRWRVSTGAYQDRITADGLLERGADGSVGGSHITC